MGRKAKRYVDEELRLDKFRRMLYMPEYHFNHGKKFTEEELEYICKFYEFDGPRSISLALGRTETTIMSKMYELKKKMCEGYRNQYEYYRNKHEYYL